MRFLFTSSFYPPYHIGGADTHVKYFAEKLAAKGHEVHVFFSMDAFRFKRPYEKKTVDYKGVIVHAAESPLGKMEPILNYTFKTQKATLDAYQELARSRKFDVIHHHNVSLLGYDVLKRQGTHRNVYSAHDFWLVCPKFDLYKFGSICETKICAACVPLHGKPYPVYRLFPDFRRTIDNDIDLIVAPSAYMKERILREYKKDVQVLWNFVPPAPKNLKAVEEKDYFLFVGQLEPHKGIIQLLETMKGSRHKLLIFGKGSLEQAVKDLIEKDKLHNVTYKGWASTPDEVLRHMKQAKALIMPSLWAENNPVVALEALSVGTPVIGTTNGGVPEIVEMVDKELMFDSKDFSQLKRILDAFESKKYSRAKLQGVWKRHFSWEAFDAGLKKVGYYGK